MLVWGRKEGRISFLNLVLVNAMILPLKPCTIQPYSLHFLLRKNFLTIFSSKNFSHIFPWNVWFCPFMRYHSPVTWMQPLSFPPYSVCAPSFSQHSLHHCPEDDDSQFPRKRKYWLIDWLIEHWCLSIRLCVVATQMALTTLGTKNLTCVIYV